MNITRSKPLALAAAGLVLVAAGAASAQGLAPNRFECSAADVKPTRFVYQTAGSPLLVKGSILGRTFTTDTSFGVATIEAEHLSMWVRLEGVPGAKTATVNVHVMIDGKALLDMRAGTVEIDKPIAFGFARDPKGVRMTLGEKSELVPGTVPGKIEVRLACQAGFYRFDNVELGAAAPVVVVAPVAKPGG